MIGRGAQGWRRWFRSSAEVEAENLRDVARKLGAVPCVEATRGSQVTVVGTLRTVTLRPQSGVPALEAELYDGSGVVVLTWLGRRVIRGITPGRTVVAKGRITEANDRRTMFNPQYDLVAGG